MFRPIQIPLIIMENQQPFPRLLIRYLQISVELRFLLGFSAANLIVSLYAFASGLKSKNPELTEQSFDCFMHSVALAFMLYAGIRAKHGEVSIRSPYGLQKLQTLAGLTMCLYILMIALIHLMRNLHHLFESSQYLLSLVSVKAEVHESQPLLSYNYVRILVSLGGMLTYVEYALFVQIKSRDIPIHKDENHTRFITTYREVILDVHTPHHYESHYIGMHAVFLFFLTDVMLNVGQCVEYMLGSVIEFHAIGLLVLLINMMVIYLFVKPLLKQTGYALLLACDIEDDYKHLINRLSLIEGVSKVQVKAWGAIAKKSRDAVVELEIFKPEFSQQIRSEAQLLVQEQFQHCWVAIHS